MHATIASPSPSLSPDKTHESEYESESGRHESKSESESSKSGLESDSSPDSDSSLPNTGKQLTDSTLAFNKTKEKFFKNCNKT